MSLFPCFAPAGKVTIHQRMEAGVVAGLSQVAEFMDDDVLGAPVRQE